MIHKIEVDDVSELQEVSDEELAEYELGQIVQVDDGAGIIAAILEGEFGWPGDTSEVDPDSDERVKAVKEDDEEIVMQASAENPLYVVALQDGGSVVAEADEISTDASLDRGGERIDSWQEMGGEVGEAELAAVYDECESPDDPDEWREAKARLVRERNAEALAEYVSSSDLDREELSQYSAEELLNIPGVDDPGVGFDSDPNGWDRTSYLDAWASVGGMWRTCYPRMVRHFGPNMAKRWCAALKDEVLGTEEWRGDF